MPAMPSVPAARVAGPYAGATLRDLSSPASIAYQVARAQGATPPAAVEAAGVTLSRQHAWVIERAPGMAEAIAARRQQLKSDALEAVGQILPAMLARCQGLLDRLEGDLAAVAPARDLAAVTGAVAALARELARLADSADDTQAARQQAQAAVVQQVIDAIRAAVPSEQAVLVIRMVAAQLQVPVAQQDVANRVPSDGAVQRCGAAAGFGPKICEITDSGSLLSPSLPGSHPGQPELHPSHQIGYHPPEDQSGPTGPEGGE